MGCAGSQHGVVRSRSTWANPYPQSHKPAKEVVNGFDLHMHLVCERAKTLQNKSKSTNLGEYKFGEQVASASRREELPSQPLQTQVQPILMPFNRVASHEEQPGLQAS